MAWYWVDLAIVIAIALSMLTGFVRGFIKEAIALCVWLTALWAAFHYAAEVAPWLKEYIQNETARFVAAFMLLLISILIAGGILNFILSFILKRTGLSGTDRILGLGFGLVRGVFIVSFIIVVIKMTISVPPKITEESKLYAQFEPITGWLYQLMPQFIKKVEAIDALHTFIDVPVIAEEG